MLKRSNDPIDPHVFTDQFIIERSLITSFAVISNLFLEHKEVQSHLDAQLALRGLTIQQLISGYKGAKDMQWVQDRVNIIPSLEDTVLKNTSEKIIPPYEKIQFQVLDKQGNLILHSFANPKFGSNTLGFSDKWRPMASLGGSVY